MNAAKRIKKLIQEGNHLPQVDILKQLVLALHLGQPFDLRKLYEIDYPFFEIAMQLLNDWRLGYHMDTQGKLVERLFCEYPELILPDSRLPATR